MSATALGNAEVFMVTGYGAGGGQVPQTHDSPEDLLSLEQLESDGQIFLWILAESLDHLLRLVHGLIGMVIKRAVLRQLAKRPFAFIDILKEAIQITHHVVKFLRKGGVFGQLANRPLAAVDLSHKLVGIGDGSVEIVIE